MLWCETTGAQNCKGFLVNSSDGSLILGATYAYTSASSNVPGS